MEHITRGLDRIIFKIGEEEEKGDKYNFEEEKSPSASWTQTRGVASHT